MMIFDDFFYRAIIAGIGIVLIAAPMGCIVVWRGMAYFGDTLAHGMILGVAIAIAMNVNLLATSLIFATVFALLLALLARSGRFSSDGMLGLLSHATLAIGLTVIAFLPPMRVDLISLLTGGILTVGINDIITIYGGGAIIGVILILIWRNLIAHIVSPEISDAEIGNSKYQQLLFVIILAWTIAIAMQAVGILLITALLIIPALAARILSSSPEIMAAISIIIGILSVLFGMNGSLEWNIPAGPSIVVAATILFVILSVMKSLILTIKALRARCGKVAPVFRKKTERKQKVRAS